MLRTTPHKGLTQVELLVTVAALGLLGTVLRPTLSDASKDSSTATCLAHLRLLASASFQYATEDEREQFAPLHRSIVRWDSNAGFSTDSSGVSWSVRAAEPHAFGGQTPTVPFHSGSGTVMMNANGIWSTATRPLNKYADVSGLDGPNIGPQPRTTEAFHCPADTGMPFAAAYETEVLPGSACDVPLYDMLGNSYRTGAIGLVWGSTTGQFTSTISGHTASSIISPLSETILYAEPIFLAATKAVFSPVHEPFPGWHGQLDADNVAYCDGSARLTEVGELHQFTSQELRDMGYTTSFGWGVFLRWGIDWRIDCYPTPGALIRKYKNDGSTSTPNPTYTGWPFTNYQSNPAP